MLQDLRGRLFAAASVTLAALAVGACSGGGGGSSGGGTNVAGTATPPVLASGANAIAADSSSSDPSTAADRQRLGITAVDRTYSLTSPAGESLELSATGIGAAARGREIVRLAVGGPATTQGSATVALRQAGLEPRAGNLIESGTDWVESRGDGFARITVRGAISSDQLLYVQREDEQGRRSTAAVAIKIGPRGPLNRTFPGVTPYAGLKSTTDLFSSNAYVFGMPAITGSGDRVSVVAIDSVELGTSAPTFAACCVPGVERRQRRLQVDVATKKVTMGQVEDLGFDASSWRDTEIAGLFNVIAIAQAGADGVRLSLSFDRGGSFPSVRTLAAGRLTRLVQVEMARDYATGVLFWDSDPSGDGSQRLVLIEGRPSHFDANQSPDAFTFDSPVVLATAKGNATPLTSDLRYTSCGDLFVAYGLTEREAIPSSNGGLTAFLSRTTVRCARRLAGNGSFEHATVDTMELVGYDPALAVLGCGANAQVFVAYESQQGVRIRKSADGGASFASGVLVGTASAHAPRLFARPGSNGKTQVEALFLDVTPGAPGTELMLFRVEGDLATGASTHKLVAAQQASGKVDAVGWFGFDAVELNGDIFVAVHQQRTVIYLPPLGGRGGITPLAGLASAAPSAPAVLYPGMTQTAPAFDDSATNRLRVLQLD